MKFISNRTERQSSKNKPPDRTIVPGYMGCEEGRADNIPESTPHKAERNAHLQLLANLQNLLH